MALCDSDDFKKFWDETSENVCFETFETDIS